MDPIGLQQAQRAFLVLEHLLRRGIDVFSQKAGSLPAAEAPHYGGIPVASNQPVLSVRWLGEWSQQLNLDHIE
jgi:hypothetical protein